MSTARPTNLNKGLTQTERRTEQPQVRTELLRRPEVAEKPPARAAAVTPAVSCFLNARDQL